MSTLILSHCQNQMSSDHNFAMMEIHGNMFGLIRILDTFGHACFLNSQEILQFHFVTKKSSTECWVNTVLYVYYTFVCWTNGMKLRQLSRPVMLCSTIDFLIRFRSCSSPCAGTSGGTIVWAIFRIDSAFFKIDSFLGHNFGSIKATERYNHSISTENYHLNRLKQQFYGNFVE